MSSGTEIDFCSFSFWLLNLRRQSAVWRLRKQKHFIIKCFSLTIQIHGKHSSELFSLHSAKTNSSYVNNWGSLGCSSIMANLCLSAFYSGN